jgi:hypothetical protein
VASFASTTTTHLNSHGELINLIFKGKVQYDNH